MIETETERLLLRNWKLSDSVDMFEYAKNDSVGPKAGWPPHEDESVSRRIISMFIEQDDELAVVLKSENKVIGSIGLHNFDYENIEKSLKQREIGYVLNPAYWGNGFIPEAVNALLDLAFHQLNLDKIWCGHSKGNNNSKRVIEKCGFRYQFETEKERPLLGGIKEMVLYYSITKDEYEKKF